ncbi:MAG TPA: peptidase MA family metallohydrolase, partial [Candidatus Limnocylindrales bacterium]
MSARLRARSARLAVVVSAALVLLLPAAPVRAASFAFSGLDAVSQFDQGIDFSARLTASETPARVDLQLLMPGAAGPFVVTIPNTPPSGTSTVRYTLDTSGAGHLMPNTPITATWVVYPQSGPPVSSSPSTLRYADGTQHWRTLTDGIVTVHWTQGPQSFAQHAGDIALKAISTDAKLLGIDESKPVDFFIYADDTSFRNALGPGTRENVGGTAITEIRTLFMEVTPDIANDPWVGITVTHELTHQVVDDAMGNPYRNLPRWLNEGFAVYESEGYASAYRSSLSQAIASGDLLP